MRILFVCTGNTCRSPMAEAIARDRLRALGWEHVEVSSAGTSAFGPSPASGGAQRAAEGHGLDLSNHRARPLTPEVLDEADLILTMTSGHLARVAELGAGERAALMTAFAAHRDDDASAPDVPDPFGGPDEVYEATFRLLEDLVHRSLSRFDPDLNS